MAADRSVSARVTGAAVVMRVVVTHVVVTHAAAVMASVVAPREGMETIVGDSGAIANDVDQRVEGKWGSAGEERWKSDDVEKWKSGDEWEEMSLGQEGHDEEATGASEIGPAAGHKTMEDMSGL